MHGPGARSQAAVSQVVADDGGGCPDLPSSGMGSRLVPAQYGGEVERGTGEQRGCRVRVTLRSIDVQPSAGAGLAPAFGHAG